MPQPRLTLLLILASLTPAAESFVIEPYLQMAQPTAITVRWRSTTNDVGTVRYGTVPGTLTQSLNEAAGTTEHELRLTGLAASTTYFYTTEVPGDDTSAEAQFTTPPIVGSTGAVRFWALGDAGTGTSAQLNVRNAFAPVQAEHAADFIVLLGDNAYGSGQDSEYVSKCFGVYQSYFANACVWSCLGNHETYANANAPPYFNLFTFPTNAECGGTPSGTEHYYSFDYANIHFVCLDMMQSSRLATGAQALWLQDDLANAVAPWKIVFFHHPPYTHGTHNSDFEGDLIQVRTQFCPLMEAAGVDLVLCGHSHVYERSWFMRGHYGSSGTFDAATHKVQEGDGREEGNGVYQKFIDGPQAGRGTVYVVTGSAGQAGSTTPHGAFYKSLGQLGSLVVDVADQRLDVRFLRETGVFADHFTMQKTPSGPLILPGTPSGLAVVALDATHAWLRWDDVQMESAYEIEQSADGVSYSLLVTRPADTTLLELGPLLSGAEMYLRVVARNAEGTAPSAGIFYRHTPVAPLLSLARWRFQYFGSTEDAGPGASLADADYDGSSNLLEYALGTNPLRSNAPKTLTGSYAADSRRITFSFTRLARPDVTYVVESSADLSSGWTTIFSSSGEDNLEELIEVTDLNSEEEPRRFGRLRITNP